MLDFGMLPPEVNSTMMYSGPGSGPMMAAASAWDALTSQLDSFALGYSTVISELQDEVWSGPAAQAMIAAATPYMSWATSTATLTEQAAGQARAAAAAYETAFAATVPPAVVAANRTQLATLIATNFFGQNTPMIAATEAAYAGMWAQDAAAMYGYAAAAASASALTPFQHPPRTTNPAAQPGQAAPPAQAVGNSIAGNSASGNSFVGNSIAGASVPPATQPVAPSGSTASSTLATVGAFNTLVRPVVLAAQAWRTVGNAGNFIMSLNGSSGAAAPKATGGFGPATESGRVVLASVAEAEQVGKSAGRLSVPASWPAPATAEPAVPSQQQVPPAAAPQRDLPRGSARPASHGRTIMPPPGIGPMQGVAPRRGNLVFRMREDRRFQMPRPAVGG